MRVLRPSPPTKSLPFPREISEYPEHNGQDRNRELEKGGRGQVGKKVFLSENDRSGNHKSQFARKFHRQHYRTVQEKSWFYEGEAE